MSTVDAILWEPDPRLVDCLLRNFDRHIVESQLVNCQIRIRDGGASPRSWFQHVWNLCEKWTDQGHDNEDVTD